MTCMLTFVLDSATEWVYPYNAHHFNTTIQSQAEEMKIYLQSLIGKPGGFLMGEKNVK